MTQITNSGLLSKQITAHWRDYLEMCKPKVVALMLLTTWVGMCLATPGFVPLSALVFGMLGIALCASSAAVINHLLDRRIDAIMARTKKRPIVQGKVAPKQALMFAFLLGVIGMMTLIFLVNMLTAILSFITLIGYAVIYTGYLKRATPQNIVIGGLAGAAPPLLGWTAVTGHFDPQSLLLVLIIFTWTPPHFWALAIYRYEDYAKAEIPMLPVAYGIKLTKQYVLLYTILLCAVTALPFAVRMSGWLYFIGAMALGGRFLYWAIVLLKSDKAVNAMKTFRYSTVYLMLLFVVLLADHYLV